MRRRSLKGTSMLAVLALGSALLIAACGSSESTADTSTAVDTPASSGEIVMSGMIDYPMTFVTLDTDYMDWVTVTADDPDTGSTDYDGVRLDEIFSYVGVQSDATTVTVTGYDGTSTELDLSGIDEDALLTVTDDNAFDLIMPGMDKTTWIEDVTMMEFE